MQFCPLAGYLAGITSTLNGWLHNGFKSFTCCMNFNSASEGTRNGEKEETPEIDGRSALFSITDQLGLFLMSPDFQLVGFWA
jgi:hypothetical protein